MGEFFQTFPAPKIAGLVPDYVKGVKSHNSTIEKLAFIGVCLLSNFNIEYLLTHIQYCWGGKVVALATKADSNPFSAAAAIHPAMVDANDAKDVKIPTMLLASGEEPEDEVKKFEDNLSVPKHVEIFKDQIHGWMAARADLEDARVKEEYERGYKTILKFFSANF